MKDVLYSLDFHTDKKDEPEKAILVKGASVLRDECLRTS